MKNGRFLAVVLGAITIVLVVWGTLWPVKAAQGYAPDKHLVQSSGTPAAALQNLGADIRALNWGKAYNSLANKAQFTESDFMHDVTGAYPNLRTYSHLENFETRPTHESDSEADYQVKLHWATVVGDSVSTRNVRVVRNGGEWQVEWPVTKEAALPPQVIPVNYLRWDVIYRGAGDDWGSQDVDAPHVRIIDMHPVQRADGLVIMGELLNEDVVPAYVAVNATVMDKNKQAIATEGSFDKISHLLLPKAVTPFLIKFPDVQLSSVGSVNMQPFSQLIPASADPVIEIQNVKINPAPDASLTGSVVNQSGQIANIAHVLGTFYDKDGNIVWVADQYVDRALLPQTPVPFNIHIPEDLSRKIASQRTVVSTYSMGGAA
ncbi:hypothetical protein [Occallatibacter riparius]|uniref:NTF2-like N-terminal transpeptidase domain-containing protein n=1 Tax=Occallatibacter riparius TaxID=1002689 RepID=A0A9J7BSP4_9BACT|nr:hypothetical protein [Occallatibacter riparius]UWZ83926.1 hypothetical protein MOP44_25630 [Occallatibacter riparius]